jgi:hypothetical protein
MRHDQVGLERSRNAHQQPAVLQRGQQLPVVDVEHLILDLCHLRRPLRLLVPPLGQRSPTHLVMAGVAIRHRHELDPVAGTRILDCQPAQPAITVVRMRAKGKHA